MLPNLWKPPGKPSKGPLKHRYLVMYPTDGGSHIQVPYKRKNAAVNLARQMGGTVFSLSSNFVIKERIYG